MRLLPRSRGAWVVLIVAVAAGAVAALDFAVKSADAREKSLARSAVEAVARPVTQPPVRLAAVAGPILLLREVGAVPPDAAPVVEVFDDGSYALRRPSPVPKGPRMAAAEPAIVVPSDRLGQLDARARATFCEVVGALVAERPVAADRFRTVGLRIERAELDRVLAWVR